MIENITKEKFETTYNGKRGRPTSSEWDAVRALAPNMGVRFPCRWRHHYKELKKCYGVIIVSKIRKRSNLTLRSQCRDGFISVWRDA